MTIATVLKKNWTVAVLFAAIAAGGGVLIRAELGRQSAMAEEAQASLRLAQTQSALAANRQLLDALLATVAVNSRGGDATPVETVRRILGSVEKVLDNSVKNQPADLDLSRSQAAALMDFASAYGLHGDLAKRAELTSVSLDILRRLSAHDPQGPGRQRDLSVGLEKMGDVLLGQDQLAKAHAAYLESFALRSELAAPSGVPPAATHDLSVAHERLGDVLSAQGKHQEALQAYSHSLGLREGLRATANATGEYDLSIAYERVGDAEFRMGHLSAALKNLQSCVSIRQHLAAAGQNTTLSRHTAIAIDKVAEALAASGKNGDALIEFRKALGIRETLVWANPGSNDLLRDLIASHLNTGRLFLALEQWPQAGEAFQKAVKASEQLLKVGPNTAAVQRDLFQAQIRAGDVLAGQKDERRAYEAYEKALNYAESRRAMVSYTDPAWLRELAIAYDRMGSSLIKQGQFAKAMDLMQKSRGAQDLRAKAATLEPGTHRDVALAHEGIGRVFEAQGKYSDALLALGESRTIRAGLLEAAPGDPILQRDLAIVDARVAEVQSSIGTKSQSIALLRRGREAIAALQKSDPRNETFANDLVWFDTRISRLQ